MMSSFVRGRVEREGLMPLLDLRGRGIVPSTGEWSPRLEGAGLLPLGAAADFARRRECGDDCHIFTDAPDVTGQIRVLGMGDRDLGTPLVRTIATMRLLGPLGLRIVFDWEALGLDLAQVALSFGASDLAGRASDRKRVEAFVRRARYSPS
jgi:hypothetical protein